MIALAIVLIYFGIGAVVGGAVYRHYYYKGAYIDRHGEISGLGLKQYSEQGEASFLAGFAWPFSIFFLLAILMARRTPRHLIDQKRMKELETFAREQGLELP